MYYFQVCFQFKENGKHKKGHSTKGEHNIHKKEEYEKTKHFYDESHEEGEHEKHGGYHEEHAHKKASNWFLPIFFIKKLFSREGSLRKDTSIRTTMITIMERKESTTKGNTSMKIKGIRKPEDTISTTNTRIITGRKLASLLIKNMVIDIVIKDNLTLIIIMSVFIDKNYFNRRKTCTCI